MIEEKLQPKVVNYTQENMRNNFTLEKTKTNKQKKKHTHTNKITGFNNHWSLISLNINELNFPIKRHRLTDWIRKQDPAFCNIQEKHFKEKDRQYFRVKRLEKGAGGF